MKQRRHLFVRGIVLRCWCVEVLMLCARCSGVQVRGGGRGGVVAHGSGFDH